MSARTPAQMFALVFGIVYLAIGIVGFPVTGFDEFAANTDEALIIFDINPLHNLVHIALGVVWIAGARTASAARTVNVALGAALALVTVLGFVGALQFLSIDNFGNPDNFLHLVSAALSLYFGTAGAGRATA